MHPNPVHKPKMHCNVFNPKYMRWACSLLLTVISLTSGWIWTVWHPRQHVHVVTRATLPKVNKSQADWSRISPPSLYWLGHKTDRCKVLQGVNNLKWWYLQATTKRPKGGLQWNFDVWICVQVTAKHQPPLFGSCEKCFFRLISENSDTRTFSTRPFHSLQVLSLSCNCLDIALPLLKLYFGLVT